MRAKTFDSNSDPREWLFRLLSSRSYTEFEVVERLKKRGVDERRAKTLVAEFRDMGLLDDAAYAALFAEGRSEWGTLRIRHELERRGVSKKFIASALTQLTSSDGEKARLLGEEWREQGIAPEKIFGRLLRRGFSRSDALHACKGEESVDW